MPKPLHPGFRSLSPGKAMGAAEEMESPVQKAGLYRRTLGKDRIGEERKIERERERHIYIYIYIYV